MSAIRRFLRLLAASWGLDRRAALPQPTPHRNNPAPRGLAQEVVGHIQALTSHQDYDDVIYRAYSAFFLAYCIVVLANKLLRREVWIALSWLESRYEWAELP